MSLPPLPKKPKDALSDKLTRAENSRLKNIKKERDTKCNSLKDKEVKESTMDFIFGRTKTNPLAKKGK